MKLLIEIQLDEDERKVISEENLILRLKESAETILYYLKLNREVVTLPLKEIESLKCKAGVK